MEQGERNGLTGQWTKLSTELPNPVWPNCICRVGEELFLFGECAMLNENLIYVDYRYCGVFKFFCQANEEKEQSSVSSELYSSKLCQFPQQPNELFDGWTWEALGRLDKVGTHWSATTAIS